MLPRDLRGDGGERRAVAPASCGTPAVSCHPGLGFCIWVSLFGLFLDHELVLLTHFCGEGVC